MDDSQGMTVSFTSRAMAAVRAWESRREDALFNDPFAERLAGKELMEKSLSLLEQYEEEGKPYGQVRTRFLDDFLWENSVNIRQVVLLGAGLDTRAFRLSWPPGTYFYEIDQEDVISYKNGILAGAPPSCDRRSIVADLGESAWVELLLAEGFKPEEPSIWILEGLFYYLTEAQAKNLMARVNDLAAVGSCLGCDLINNAACNGSDDWAKFWQFGCDVPEDFLADYGWRAKAIQPGEEGAFFGRYTFQIPPREDKEGIHIFFVTAFKEGDG